MTDSPEIHGIVADKLRNDVECNLSNATGESGTRVIVNVGMSM